MTSPRFAIGIDLGTTNCVLSYVDLRAQNARPEVLPIPQLHSLGTVAKSPLLLPASTFPPHPNWPWARSTRWARTPAPISSSAPSPGIR